MSHWDLAIYSGAGYLAVIVLVRFMLVRRDKLLAEVRERLEWQAKAASRKSKTPPR